MNRADTTDDTSVSTSRSFPAGCVVTVYGYSIPTGSVVPEGVGTLASTLGRFNVLILNSTAPPDSWPPATGGSGGGGGGGGGFATGWSGSRKNFTLDVGKDVSGWDGFPGSTAVEAFGSAGYALLVSSDGFGFTTNGATDRLLGCEVAYYEVSRPVNRRAARRRAPAQPALDEDEVQLRQVHDNPALHFIPKHTYGDPNDPLSMALKSRASTRTAGSTATWRSRRPASSASSMPISIEESRARRPRPTSTRRASPTTRRAPCTRRSTRTTGPSGSSTTP